MLGIPQGLVLTLAIVLLVLAVGSVIRCLGLRRVAPEVAASRRSSLIVWWLLLLAFGGALLVGPAGVALLFAVASLLALHEFDQLVRSSSRGTAPLYWLVTSIGIVHFSLLAVTASMNSLAYLPLALVAGLSICRLVSGPTDGFLRAAGGYTWAGMLMVFGLSHAVALVQLPASNHLIDMGNMGWCLFVVLLTEWNDIAQALIGRQIGKRQIMASISPHKTWEGLAGGWLTTSLLAMLLAPPLTTLGMQLTPLVASGLAFAAGSLISISGFLGDLTMSALKRESGVKDSSHLLPGMGGMIDRIDSLTLSAPAVYYLGLATSPA